MRILLDENLPVALVRELAGHVVDTVAGRGWSGVRNGELLRRMNRDYDALITMDRGMRFQQQTLGLSFGIVVIRARSNRIRDLQPLVPTILGALASLQAGELRQLGTI